MFNVLIFRHPSFFHFVLYGEAGTIAFVAFTVLFFCAVFLAISSRSISLTASLNCTLHLRPSFTKPYKLFLFVNVAWHNSRAGQFYFVPLWLISVYARFLFVLFPERFHWRFLFEDIEPGNLVVGGRCRFVLARFAAFFGCLESLHFGFTSFPKLVQLAWLLCLFSIRHYK